MTDINFSTESATPSDPVEQTKDTAEIISLIELLFFAYRDFVSDPDEILKDYGFGRAHHRVIHFVGRNPGMRVSELLDILRITKQSLARVLRDLIEKGFVYQREGAVDRRQRLLFLTGDGEQLHARLAAPQVERIRRALSGASDGVKANYHDILFRMIDEDDRDHVLGLIREKLSPPADR